MRGFFASVVQSQIANTYELINSDVLILKCAKMRPEFQLQYFAETIREHGLPVSLVALEGNYLAFGLNTNDEIERVAEFFVLGFLEKGITVTIHQSSISASDLRKTLESFTTATKLTGMSEAEDETEDDTGQFDSEDLGSGLQENHNSAMLRWSSVTKSSWETPIREFRILATDLERKLGMFSQGVTVAEPTQFSRLNMKRKNVASFGLPDIDLKQLDALIDTEV